MIMGNSYFILFLFILLVYSFYKIFKMSSKRQVVILYNGKKYVFKTFYSKFKMISLDDSVLCFFNTEELRLFFDVLKNENNCGGAEVKVFGVSNFDNAYSYLIGKIN